MKKRRSMTTGPKRRNAPKAARLCGEAGAGQILVDRKVYMAIEAIADVEQSGELTLKGFHRPVVAYDVRTLRA